jgi:transposase
MTEKLTIDSERVDDIPLLLAQQERMGVPELLDRHFAVHGNRQGASLGCLAAIWLSHLLSESDHRMSHVRGWARQRLVTLRQCSGQVVAELDFTDDRLADVLTALSDDGRWQAFERALNENLLRVYDLEAEQVRLDSTTASGYWAVTEDGLLQFGHSKDHRPDLPQVKVMLASLDPLGLPLVTHVLSGERADDPLYVPAIAEVRQGVGRCGLLYIGDSKMGALEVRSFVQAGGDFYLCPLGLVQLSAPELRRSLEPVWTGEQLATVIYRMQEDGVQEPIADGFELTQELTADINGLRISWTERRLIIRSYALAEAARRGLHARLTKAQAALAALMERKQGKKVFTEVAELRKAAEAIVQRHDVTGLLRLDYQQIVHECPVRAYGARPAAVRIDKECYLQVSVDESAVQAVERTFGWRVYATNQTTERLSLAQAVLAYRTEYVIERDFARLKGKPLSLTPMYLRTDERVTGLIRLLTIGLRVLTLLEFSVRRRLAAEHASLSGLYQDSPKHATARPTAERLLEAFKGLTLTTVHLDAQTHRHLPPLSVLQQRILALLGLPTEIYTMLSAVSTNPP